MPLHAAVREVLPADTPSADGPGHQRVVNLSAGPTGLPRPVMEQIRRELADYRGTGMSVMEISHRSPQIISLIEETTERARRLLRLGSGHEVLMLQGGGSLQFAMVPLNLSRPGDAVDYIDTGYWAGKAIQEACGLGRDVAVVASSQECGYTAVPLVAGLRARPGARYLHLVTNNTVEGTQFPHAPRPGVPVVADMSSDLMTGPFDPDAYDLVYAHAQKNIGIAGVTLVVVRTSLLDGAMDGAMDGVPVVMRYRTHAEHRSNYHTPPTFSIYVLNLMLTWLECQAGGLAGIGAVTQEKAALLYGYLDSTDFYRCPVPDGSRSLLNVVFSPRDPGHLPALLAHAEREGIAGLAGHRSLGGCRASLFNGVTPAMVSRLIDVLHTFAREHGSAPLIVT